MRFLLFFSIIFIMSQNAGAQNTKNEVLQWSRIENIPDQR